MIDERRMTFDMNKQMIMIAPYLRTLFMMHLSREMGLADMTRHEDFMNRTIRQYPKEKVVMEGIVRCGIHWFGRTYDTLEETINASIKFILNVQNRGKYPLGRNSSLISMTSPS